MLARWLVRLRALLRRDHVEAEFDEELRYHLDREIERNLDRGMSPEEARRAARRAFGDPGRLKEEARETWRWLWVDELAQDLGYGVRRLRRSPGFTVVAVLSLGFGIGATSTLFGVVDALDFRPLPYPDAERLVWLAELLPLDDGRCPGCPWRVRSSVADEWQARARSYDAVALWSDAFGAYFPNGDVVRAMSVGQVSPGFFEILGASPQVGRAFVPDDTLPGAEPVALLSWATWQGSFGGDPGVLGTTLEYYRDRSLTDSRTVTVVGVLPEDFRFDGQSHAFWAPLAAGGGAGSDSWVDVLARLRPGVTRAEAEEELSFLHRRLTASQPDASRNVAVRPLRYRLGLGAGEGRGVLLGVTGLVLLSAVMNVAGLSLARTLSRRGELTLRSALGARRLRLVRQLVVEGSLLGVLGGAVGVMVAFQGMDAARRWFRLEHAAMAPEIDHRILAFIAGASLLVGILTALLPAGRTVLADLHPTLRKGPGTAFSPSVAGVTGGLLVVQLAAGLVLLTGAGLLGSEFLKLRYLDIGFDPEGLYRVSLSGSDDPAHLESPEAWRPRLEQAGRRAGAVRGVSGAALRHLSAIAPAVVRPEGRVEAEPGGPDPRVEAVSHEYFETLETPILRGRGFTAADAEGTRPVAVLNRAAAVRFWPGENPLGRQVFVGDSIRAGEFLTVIGVVADLERGEMIERHWSVVYRPLEQSPLYHPAASLFVRIPDQPGVALPELQGAVREALGHPTSPFSSVEEELGRRFQRERFNALALNLFAVFGLLLASMGIYGSVAYRVARRTREIGIRMALGAERRRVLRLVGRHATGVVAGGIVLGLLGSVAFTRVLRSFVSATSVTELWMFAASGSLIGVVALFATWIPARKALAVDPVVALRTD